MMNKVFKKIVAAMDEYYEINNIEVDPFDDETQDKAIEYTAKKLGMTFRQVCEYLD